MLVIYEIRQWDIPTSHFIFSWPKAQLSLALRHLIFLPSPSLAPVTDHCLRAGSWHAPSEPQHGSWNAASLFQSDLPTNGNSSSPNPEQPCGPSPHFHSKPEMKTRRRLAACQSLGTSIHFQAISLLSQNHCYFSAAIAFRDELVQIHSEESVSSFQIETKWPWNTVPQGSL